MGQPPQMPSQHAEEQLYYLVPPSGKESLDLSYLCGEMDDLQLAHHHPWIMQATMIDDDDLQFGGKPLSSWYEEDRRRCSLGEDSAPSPDFLAQVEAEEQRRRQQQEDDEEKRRGRPRERPHYRSGRMAAAEQMQKEQKHHHHHHHHHHTKVSKPLTVQEATNH